MAPFDILRRYTTPMTDEQSTAFVMKHYGVGRENASLDASLTEVAKATATPELTPEEEAVLDGITTSGQFTLEQTLTMYARVKRLR